MAAELITLARGDIRGGFGRARSRLHGLLFEGASAQRMAFTAFVIRMISAAIMFVSQTLLARWMGGHEFGNYVYVLTWLTLLADVLHLGVPLTAQRFIPQYRETGAFALLRGYLSASRWMTFAAATAAALIGAALVYLLGEAIENDLVLPFYFACIALPFYSLNFMLDGIARSYNWVRLALVPAYILRPVLLIAAVVWARTAGLKLDATLVCGLVALAAWLSAFAQLLQLNRSLGAVVPAGDKVFVPQIWLKAALPILVVWSLYTLLTTTDVIVLKQFRPAEEVAHYYAASKTLALVGIIYFAVGAASAHRFTTFHVIGDRAGLADFATRMVRITFWPSVALTALLLACGQWVLTLFGPGFADAYPFMAVLAIGQLARASIGPAERLLNMTGEQRICAVAYGIAFAVNLGGCFALAPRFGGIGAAAATAAAFVTESALLAVIARYKLGLSLFVWRGSARKPRTDGITHASTSKSEL